MASIEFARWVHAGLYNQISFTFNGYSESFPRIILRHRPKPIQKVKKDIVKTDTIWTIVLEWTFANWDKFVEYASKKELVFDLVLNDTFTGIYTRKALFKCYMTQRGPHIYEINTEDIYDVKKFKKIGIKTIKKEDKMVAIVKMVE